MVIHLTRASNRMKTKEEVLEEFRIQSIREAATRVIARKGISGASMQEIADEAGVAKGTLYLYFRSQQELLDAAVDQALTELLAKVDLAFTSDGPFPQRLEMLIRSHLEFLAENADLFQIHLATKYPEGADPSATRCDRASREQYQIYMGRLTSFLAAAIEEGEIRHGDPRRIAMFVQEGMVAILFDRLNEPAPPPIEEDVAWIAEVILRGIATDQGSRREK